ncbi:MAG: hypothetical protein ACI97A_004026 [Planctomycetota bacterium]|jgi:hypothetical protein
MSVSGFLLLFLVIFFMFPLLRGGDQKVARAEKLPILEIASTSEEDQAYAVAEEALKALMERVKELDQSALRFERDRARGTYGSGNQGLLKYWQKWSDGFLERVKVTAEEFDIRIEQGRDQWTTPVHVAFRVVGKIPFEIRLSWENGNSIEGLPARLGLDETILEARKWIESGSK